MRLSIATYTLAAVLSASSVKAQTCSGVSGAFTLIDLHGQCSYDLLLEEYTRQVFDNTGSTCSTNTLTAKEDFDGKLMAAFGTATGEEGGAALCKALYDGQAQT